MDDLRILDDLFEKHNDEIHFESFKRSNIVWVSNENQGDYNKEIIFNTRSLASPLINYKDAYVLLEIEVKIPYDGTDQGKKSVPKLISLKRSYELVEYLRISLYGVIITYESYVNRSSLVNYVINNAFNDPTSYRNVSKAISTGLNVTSNQFISKDTYYSPQDDDDEDASDRFHYINFEIPIFLKDLSEFFRKVTVLKFAEFNINLKFIDNMIISSREGIKTTIKSCHLFVKEVELYENEHIKYLKMLNDGYSKTINLLECHTRVFNNKMSEINENFYVNNVQNFNSVYIYGILDTNKEGLKYDLPSVKFEKPHLNIDKIEFEKPIDNDISAYDELKSKSNHYDNFLITYPNFKNYYRIYCFNVARNIRDDHNNKFMNIITNMETTSCTVYVVLRTHGSVKLNYSKENGLIVYKYQKYALFINKMIEIGYNFLKKDLNKIKKFKNPTLDIDKNGIKKFKI